MGKVAGRAMEKSHLNARRRVGAVFGFGIVTAMNHDSARDAARLEAQRRLLGESPSHMLWCGNDGGRGYQRKQFGASTCGSSGLSPLALFSGFSSEAETSTRLDIDAAIKLKLRPMLTRARLGGQ